MKKILFSFIFVFLMLPLIVNGALTDNITVYHKMDNVTTSGSTSIDSTGTLNGTLQGSSTSGWTGIIVDSYASDGNGNYIDMNTALMPANGDFTANMWWRGNTDSGLDYIYSQYDTGQAGRWLFDYSWASNLWEYSCITTGESFSDSSITIDTWYMVTFRRSGTNFSVFIDGIYKDSCTNAGNLYTGDSFQLGWDESGAESVGGRVDEFGFWDRALSASEISELNNAGIGLSYPFAPPSANFSITVVSNWSGVSINNFSANINGTILNTTTGTIITSILLNDNDLYNITIFSDVRFNQTYNNYNVSSNLEASLKQTQVNISFKFSSGDLIIFPINLTALDISQFFNVTGGYEILFPDDGINNFSVFSDINLFSPFIFSLNLTALDNSSFVFVVNETQNVITFLDENSSNPIDNTSIIVEFPSGITLNLSTNSSGQINFSYIQNNSLDFGDYSYYFSKLGYINITLSDVINESNIPHTRTYNLSRAKLNIFIYDRVTRELLNGTDVSIAFIGLFNETTDTGVLIKDNLTIVGGDYLIYASADGYKTSIRSLTFTNQEEFTLNFYLLNLSASNAGTLFVSTKDSFFRDITGAKVDLLEYVPTSLSYVSVDSCVSNVNAQCSFGVELNTKVYYIRATSVIDGTVFVAETSQNGEIFTVDNDIRNLIFFTTSTFSISTSTNLIYRPTETFVNNVSSISVDFFTSDGTAVEVCVEYFLLNGNWTSVTGDTYCLFSSNALQNIDVDVTLNRSNTYQARIYVKESFDNILLTYDYPDVTSTGSIFNDDFKATIIMILWILALAFSMHQKNITLFFFLACVISWAEVIIFPIFSIVIISVFKTIIALFGMYIARKKEDFQ